MELSKSLQKSLYKEVCSDVVGRLSVGLGVSKEELFGPYWVVKKEWERMV
jgi:hypothetical protein